MACVIHFDVHTEDSEAAAHVGYVAYLVDTEGDIFGLHQSDPNARG